MRIPITRADVDNGRILAMVSTLANSSLSLDKDSSIPALAYVLGYSIGDDLHDLAGPVDAAFQCSRVTIFNHVAWRVSRGYGLDLNTARDITASLTLSSLDVDSFTFEAAQERQRLLDHSQGRYMVMDECWHFVKPEHDKTPRFVEAGVPGYRVAVVANKTIFQWSKLEKLWDSLPSSFSQDLASEARYEGYGNDTDREIAFIQQELLPLCFTQLSSTIKELKLRPHGFTIVWLFNDGGETMGDCIGRVLYNRVLGGIIPRFYAKDTDEIFEDAARILCGEIIHAHVETFTPEASQIYAKRFGGDGYDFEADTKPSYGETITTSKDMELLSANIGYRVVEEQLQLCGSIFVENGQTYIRRQDRFILDIPVSMGDALNVPTILDQEAIPTEGHLRFALAQKYEQQTFEASVARMQSPESIRSLTGLILGLVHVPNFNAYCDALIDDDLPVDDDAAFDSDDACEKRYELERLTKYGQDIKRIFPGLSALKDTSLGYMLLSRHGSYLGGRSTGWFKAPTPHDMQDQSYYLVTCLMHVAGCNMKKGIASGIPNFDALATVAVLMLDGLADVTDLLEEYEAIECFCRLLVAWGEFENTVDKWRGAELALHSLREQGEYLYVQAPVNSKLDITFNATGSGKSTLLYNLMLNARKNSVPMVQATQSLADFI